MRQLAVSLADLSHSFPHVGPLTDERDADKGGFLQAQRASVDGTSTFMEPGRLKHSQP